MAKSKRSKLMKPQPATNLLLPESHLKEDFISRLPENILQFIISKLSTREGAATCILSRSWRTLWSSSTSRLDFDIPTIFGHNIPIYKFRSKQFSMMKRLEFSQWVDRVMHLRSSSSVDLDSLRVCFPLENRSDSQVDRWIKLALARGVTDIELDFRVVHLPIRLPLKLRDFYMFPTIKDVASLKYLKLKRCVFHPPRNFTGFTSLISLSLDLINVSQHLVDNILSSCPLLECLSLENCCLWEIKRLAFSGPSLLLKYLHIHIVSDPSPLDVEIQVRNVNLISLELRGCFLASVKNAPHLVKVVLLEDTRAGDFSDVHRLETLFLTTPDYGWRVIPPLCVFSNLKRLVFVSKVASEVTCLQKLVWIIETCHSMQELELNMGFVSLWPAETMNSLTTIPETHHPNLKEVELYEFEACHVKVAFVKYLLNFAALLEKMKIFIASKLYLGNGNWTIHEGRTWEVESLEAVREHFQEIARSSTKLELSNSPNS